MLDTITQEGSDRIVWDIGPLYTEGTMTAATSATSAARLDEPRPEQRDRRRAPRRRRDLRQDLLRALRRRLHVLGPDPDLGQQPALHPDPELPLPHRGALQGRAHRHCIAPDFSASSVHSDLYVPVKPGCDAALALGVAHVLVEERLDRPRLPRRADRHAAAGARRHAALPAQLRPEEAGAATRKLYFHDEEGHREGAPRSLASEGLEPSSRAASR